MWSAFLFLVAACVFLSGPAWSATEIFSIHAAPESFNPIDGEQTTITMSATPGMTELEIHVLSPDLAQTVRTGLSLVEGATGSYTAVWNGRSDSGAVAIAGTYALRVFNRATTTFLGQVSSVDVQGIAFSPTIFTPTGHNTVDFTVQATPGQTNLSASVTFSNWPYTWLGNGCKSALLLTETSAGVYTAQWDAVMGAGCYYYYGSPYVMGNGPYTIYAGDSAVAGTVTVQGV